MSETKVLGRGDFLAVTQNRKRELVPVPELGGSVYIGELFGGQIILFNERIRQLRELGEKDVSPSVSISLMALLLSMAACDENGEPLFSEADVTKLARTNPNTLIVLSAKAMELSGLNNAAVEEVKENLKKATSADSVTTSQES
ncbi:MAG TPA: hypothetical protein VFM05_09755 [Candidatus Saccharimonadales bacterium]|nr:hypothetical protein [Candidatus Saccharimonadales bacterium]